MGDLGGQVAAGPAGLGHPRVVEGGVDATIALRGHVAFPTAGRRRNEPAPRPR